MKNLLKYKSINSIAQRIISATIPIKKLRRNLRKSLRIMLQKDLVDKLHNEYPDYYQFALFWPWGDFNIPLSLLKAFKKKYNKKVLIVCVNEFQKSIINSYEAADKIIIIDKNIYYPLFLDFDQNTDTQKLELGKLYCLSHWLFSEADIQKSYNFLELYAKMMNLDYPIETSAPNIKLSICKDYSNTVLIYPEANSFSDFELSKVFWVSLADRISSLGFDVIFNTKSKDYGLYETTFLPILEQTAMAKQCRFVIGMRSGFSDFLTINNIQNHIVIYPNTMYFKTITKEQQEKEFSRCFVIEEDKSFCENMFRICSLKMFEHSKDVEIKFNGNTALLADNILEHIVENISNTSFLETIKQKVDKAEIVSFDIFDTLLVRPYVEPNDLFDHLGKLENIPNFRRMREVAFLQAINKYKKNDIEEITLEQIYEFLPKQIQYLKEKELELEYKVLQQNFEIKEVYDYAISKNKKIILISDMFLPKDFIESVLNKNGYNKYDKLYLSSEIKKLKFTSNLYRYVLDDLQIKPENILHIGDNKVSDINQPTNLGIKAEKYTKRINQFFMLNTKAEAFYKKHSNNLTLSILFGILAMQNASDDYWYNFGFNYGGAFILGYIKWLSDNLIHDNIEQVLFVARDGYTLQKVFELLNNNIKTLYLYAPRLTSLCCTLDIQDKLEATDFECIDTLNSIINYFKDKTDDLGISIPNLETKQEYLDFYNNNIGVYKRLANNEKLIYQAYLHNLGISYKKTAFIDVMTSFFTAQKFISSFFSENNLIGYYYWVSKVFNLHNLSIDYKNYTNIPYNIPIFELLITSPELPIEKIKDNMPVYKQASNFEITRSEICQSISQAEVDFAKKCLNIFDTSIINFDLDIITEWISSFVENIDNTDMENFKNIYHSWNANHSDYEPVIKVENKNNL